MTASINNKKNKYIVASKMSNYNCKKKSFQTTDYRLLFFIYICYIFTITNRVGMSILLYDSVQPFLTIDIVYNSIGNQQEKKITAQTYT